MARKKENRKVLSILLTDEEYENVQKLAAKRNMSMSQLGRDFINQGMNGQLTESNIEFLAPLLRNLIRDVSAPQIERLAKMVSKTCIISATATYLTADAIYKWVPPEQREEVSRSFDRAYKQGIMYNKNKVNPGDILDV
ncbi:MAG: hypothetical protein H2184_15785 [Candidatus Galacturonibacter soehngenii]|nr:hypothetical protein [Candidatus Galacturonibacter soehngenii]